MITVKNDFEKRCDEVNEYFKLLDRVVKQDAELFLPNNATKKYQQLSTDLHKVLKANVILILYNLMESSIRSALIETYQQITDKEVKYSDVTDEIRSIWIKSNYRNFKDKGSPEIVKILNAIADDLLNIPFDTNEISGNIDAKKVKEFAGKIGFSSTVHHSTDDGEVLVRIKNERNILAHGERSFSECGRSYTVGDLEKMKNQTITYLRRILSNIEAFLAAKRYLK